MPYVGVRNTFVTGTLFVSLWSIIFGFLPELLENRSVFIAGCFTCRVGIGIGITAINNALFVAAAVSWPDDVAFRLGTLETGTSIGSMIGPVAAGLADLGGYYLPFLVVGLLPLIPATMAAITMSIETPKSRGGVSILTLLKIPGVFIMVAVAILCLALPVMLDPILSTHLQPFNLSLTSIGAVFLIFPLSYTIVSPIVGKIAGLWKGHELLLIMFGIYGMGGSFLVLGPAALFGLQPYEQLWPTLVCLGTLALFNAFAFVPSYERFISYAKYTHLKIDGETLAAAVGSLCVMMMPCGELLAPTLAGSLFDALGFQWTMTIGGLLCLFTGTMLLCIFIRFGNGEITWTRSDGKKCDGEKEALLSSIAAHQ